MTSRFMAVFSRFSTRASGGASRHGAYTQTSAPATELPSTERHRCGHRHPVAANAAKEAERKADAAQEKDWRGLPTLSVRCTAGVLAAGCALLALFVLAGGE
jgi:hypothetical protein